jgi:hypothetical protein
MRIIIGRRRDGSVGKADGVASASGGFDMVISYQA